MSKKTGKENEKVINMNGAKNQSGAKGGPEKLSEEEVNKRVDRGMMLSLDSIMRLRMDLRHHREQISYIIGIIEYSKFFRKAEKLKGRNSINTVGNTLSELMIAKAALGESLKVLIPAPELMAFDYWRKFLKKNDNELFGALPNEEVNSLMKDLVNHLPENRKDDEIYNSQMVDFLSEYCNPYKYPKQAVEDIEPVLDDIDLKNLHVPLPEGMYQGEKGENLEKASQLNNVQLVDFIKSLIKQRAQKVLFSIPQGITGNSFRIYERYNPNNPFNTKFILLTHLQGAYRNLMQAKNIFGYTFQIFV